MSPTDTTPLSRPPANVAVVAAADDAALAEQAEALAAQLHLPLASSTTERQPEWVAWLVVTAHRLELRSLGDAKLQPVFVDFVHGPDARRLSLPPSRQQPLFRALDLRNHAGRVFDTTAGLGNDALMLARWGCTVTAVERHPALHALLADGLARACAHASPTVAQAAARVTAVLGDARAILAALPDNGRPDVVYLDPMYPPKRKQSALSSARLRLLRELVGDDPDAGELLSVARRVARRRVVVKRPQHADPIAEPPVATHNSKLARFDVYRATPAR